MFYTQSKHERRRTGQRLQKSVTLDSLFFSVSLIDIWCCTCNSDIWDAKWTFCV